MRPSQLATKLPSLPDDADPDLRRVVTALVDILRSMDELPPIYLSGGDVLIGNRPLGSGAPRGYLNFPAFDGNGPPTGTPTDHRAGDPIVRTRGDNKLWAYDFSLKRWVEMPTGDDDNEILELLLLIHQELKLQRELV